MGESWMNDCSNWCWRRSFCIVCGILIMEAIIQWLLILIVILVILVFFATKSYEDWSDFKRLEDVSKYIRASNTLLKKVRRILYPWSLNSWTPANEFVSSSSYISWNLINSLVVFLNVFAFSMKSSIFSYINATLNGLPTIRSSSIEIEKLMRYELKKIIWWVARSS